MSAISHKKIDILNCSCLDRGTYLVSEDCRGPLEWFHCGRYGPMTAPLSLTNMHALVWVLL